MTIKTRNIVPLILLVLAMICSIVLINRFILKYVPGSGDGAETFTMMGVIFVVVLAFTLLGQKLGLYTKSD